jgi:hypothetical protein
LQARKVDNCFGKVARKPEFRAGLKLSNRNPAKAAKTYNYPVVGRHSRMASTAFLDAE